MTKSEAIKWADSRPSNFFLQWHVVEYGDAYCVVTNENLKRHPNFFVVVHSTSGVNIMKI